MRENCDVILGTNRSFLTNFQNLLDFSVKPFPELVNYSCMMSVPRSAKNTFEVQNDTEGRNWQSEFSSCLFISVGSHNDLKQTAPS